MADQAFQKTLTVDVGDDKFEFKIPSLHDEIRIGSKMTRLRQVIDPDWDGVSGGLDYETAWLLRACATTEVLLQKSSCKWLWKQGADGTPYVDTSAVPEDKSMIFADAYKGYTSALSSFRQKGSEPTALPVAEDVANKPNS